MLCWHPTGTRVTNTTGLLCSLAANSHSSPCLTHSLFPPAFYCLKTKPLTSRSTQPRAGLASVLRAAGSSCQQHTNLHPLLLFQYRTVLVPVVKSPAFPKIPGKPVNFIYFAPDDKNPEIHRPVFLELTPSPEMTYRTLAGTSNEMNVLGIVIFSATIGTCSSRGRGSPGCHCCGHQASQRERCGTRFF